MIHPTLRCTAFAGPRRIVDHDDREIARLLADPSKRILGPLRWTDDEDLSCGRRRAPCRA